ncbi:MAG: CDP-alcohol phosphatidyltransferase family protein [Candidatus Aenigmarchaeota archaeon]|nr:CDP-alcohol phosphatidyltransferase family protein [Candidatus Aenigmarchaeota archaeon]
MAENKKFHFVNKIRSSLDKIAHIFPLPDINPNIVSGISVLLSMLFVLSIKFSALLSIGIIFIVLLLDWFDGVIARKFNRETKSGYIVDMTSDRMSEGIIFSVFFFPWFYLFTINCFLTLFSVAKKRHVVLPLRHIFIILYSIWVVLGYLSLI